MIIDEQARLYCTSGFVLTSGKLPLHKNKEKSYLRNLGYSSTLSFCLRGITFSLTFMCIMASSSSWML